MVTIGAADLGWFNVWELVRPSGMASTYVDHSDGGKIKKFDFRKEKVFDAVILQDNSTGPIHPQRKEIFEKYGKTACIRSAVFWHPTFDHDDLGKKEQA